MTSVIDDNDTIVKIKMEIDMSFSLPPSGKIRKIVALADIHIRAGSEHECRSDEYAYCIDQLLESLNALNDVDSTCAVLCGDIFHNRGAIGGSGLQLFTSLITGLSKIFPVYIICGNHDVPVIHSSDGVDMIEGARGIFENLPNVHYLDKTGRYVIGDISLCVVSVKETMERGATGTVMVENLPPFPHSRGKSVFDVALYHGTLRGSRMQSYSPCNEGVPLGWFEGFHAVILGDIHLSQTYQGPIENLDKIPFDHDGITWGYPGSLCQQNFGENPHFHGYQIWDLENKTIQQIAVPPHTIRLKINEKGLCTKKLITISELMHFFHAKYPKKIVLRFPGSTPNKTVQTIINDLNILGIKSIDYERIFSNPQNQEDTDATDADATDADANILRNPVEQWIHYIKSSAMYHTQWDEWIRKPSSLLIQSHPEVNNNALGIHNIIQKKSDEFVKRLNKLNPDDNHIKGFRLMRMKAKWILCYKYLDLDFDDMEGSIVNVSGKNGVGKSSIFDILVAGIYGNCMRSRQQYSNGDSRSINGGSLDVDSLVCNAYNKQICHTNPSIEIHVKINNEVWAIVRTFRESKGIFRTWKCEMNCLTSPDKDSLVTKKAIEDTMGDILGNSDMFMMTTMITQSQDSDFFQLSSEKQISYLNKILRLDQFKEYTDLLKESIKIHESVERHVQSTLVTLESNTCNTDTNKLKDEYNSTLEKIQQIENTAHILQQEIDLIPKITDFNTEKYEKLKKSKHTNPIHITHSIDYLKKKSWELEQYQELENIHVNVHVNVQDLETQLKQLQCTNDYDDIDDDDDYDNIDDYDDIDDDMNIDELYRLKRDLETKRLLLGIPPEYEYVDIIPTYTADELDNLRAQWEAYNVDDIAKDESIIKVVIKDCDKILEECPYDDTSIDVEIRSAQAYTFPTTTLGGGSVYKRVFEIKEIQKRLDISEKSIKDELLCIDASKPNEPEDKICDFLHRLGYRKRRHDKRKKKRDEIMVWIQRVEEINNEINSMTVRIEDMTRLLSILKDSTENMQLNKDCEACANNPIKKYLLSMDQLIQKESSDIIRLKRDRKTILKRRDIEHWKNKHAILEEECKDEEDALKWETIAREHMQMWKRWNKKELLRAQLHDVLNEKDILSKELTKLIPKWLRDLNAWKSAFSTKKNWEDILSIKPVYNQWAKGMSEINMSEWKPNEELLASVKEKLRKNAKKYNQIKRRIHRIYGAQKHKVLCDLRGLELEQFHSQDARVKKEGKLKELQKDLGNLHKDIGSLSNTIERVTRDKQFVIVLSEYLKTLTNVTASMKHMYNELDRYQAVLYEDIVIPSIVKKVNSHLSKLTANTIQLIGSIQNGTKLDWKVQKEGMEVKIWKCSGYEKQILSLSIREVLQDIMGCELGGIMLIDEAFVGSDDTNIHKVGDYLRWLVRRRGRIMIVSHMEKIKSECDVTINILYENGLSTLKQHTLET